ncbi:MAG: HoxN/HupN/NixA family nickel/cobalt transporter [Gammaproteobacteria bacterium]|nr:HoxN/HupN/NixA family nickel/cobalt transporter [Gammaproteobacteria bacterium]
MLSFTRAEWRRLRSLYGVIGLLHVCGCALYLHYSARFPALVGLGLAAYLLGLRHGFDADHISAVDDTTRYLLQQGKRPLGLGFFFSLGHSTVVFVLSVCLIASATVVSHDLPWLKSFGAVIGGGVSAAFLLMIGILNLLVVLDLLKVWGCARITAHEHVHLEELLARRGLINRLFGARLRRFMVHSWQMYPLGLLFGLGFDTASEVAVLAMTAGAAAGSLPGAAALSLPILFTAGMCAVDTTDGVLMSRAYDWAFLNPLRKMLYNIAITGVSAAVALLIGGLELLQILAGTLHLNGDLLERVERLDFSELGYGIVGLFALAWTISLAIWKWGRGMHRASQSQN